jgi:hypothetical protein
MTHIISFSKVIAHERLTARVAAMVAAVTAAQADAPGQPASPALTSAVAALLRDVYRLISREPGARSLPRLTQRETSTPGRLAALLRDAQLWLDLFCDRHLDHDDQTGDEWLTIEGLESLAGHHPKKTYPRP